MLPVEFVKLKEGKAGFSAGLKTLQDDTRETERSLSVSCRNVTETLKKESLEKSAEAHENPSALLIIRRGFG